MSNEILEILRSEMDRVAKMLPDLDPTTEEYTRAICNLGGVLYKLDGLVSVHLEPVAAPRSVIVPAEAPEPTVTTTVEAEPVAPAKDMGDYRMGLRERMADARLKGVNITDLIKKVGADKFSAVPDDKLTELADLLEAAVKELE